MAAYPFNLKKTDCDLGDRLDAIAKMIKKDNPAPLQCLAACSEDIYYPHLVKRIGDGTFHGAQR
jgi:hypothetical protein